MEDFIDELKFGKREDPEKTPKIPTVSAIKTI